MSEWERYCLPTFEEDLEKYQHIPQEKLNKFISDLIKNPKVLKNAHDLQGPLKPLWTAHFNPGGTTYCILYFICDGNAEQCFLRRGVEKFLPDSENIRSLIAHNCSKERKRIYFFRFGTHKIYNIL
jgi:mRNA-degrading endonuclease YafQ of YafQ-DinJ toxin-antitoxin module